MKTLILTALLISGSAFADQQSGNLGEVPKDCACVPCFINTGSCNGTHFNDDPKPGKNVSSGTAKGTKKGPTKAVKQ